MKKIILYLIITLFSVSVFAQTKINVTVLDAQSNAGLPGASVIVKGTTNGVSTDIDGKATINANAQDSIQVQMLGFETQIVAINSRCVICDYHHPLFVTNSFIYL